MSLHHVHLVYVRWAEADISNRDSNDQPGDVSSNEVNGFYALFKSEVDSGNKTAVIIVFRSLQFVEIL